MSKKIDTIQDRNGDVWTGRVTNVDRNTALDLLGNVIGLGIPALCGPNEPTVTVEVNGEKHSGSKVK